ncbi:MAG: tRNA uridine-5-carboxymethylaminomethyl(34) synthesis GTPase MnmE [Deltaproteobacteria bacterium]|nr:tRNA uridine-5-carboxymethylaminomethyl(34) synthesis GTPase MnmE [Deltaproteobacteria bacterium]
MTIPSELDTIAAISTPPGESGIGIVRVSGPEAVAVVSRLFRPKGGRRCLESHRVYYGEILDPADGGVIDEVLVLFMGKPRSYTREDVVEIQCHGGFLVLGRILECVLEQGARLAEPGEFTKRAFLNGRIDLVQAEAVIETIRARTEAGLRVASEQLRGRLSGEIGEVRGLLLGVLAEIEAGLDFPEEDVGDVDAGGIERDLERVDSRLEELVLSFDQGRVLREGALVGIVGRANVGKSSLLNALVGDERAIVTRVAGTTRDVIEETVTVCGLMLRIADTAGLRRWRNEVEKEGVRRTRRVVEEADLLLVVVDGSRRLSAEDRRIFDLVRDRRYMVVLNKLDLPRRVTVEELGSAFPGAEAVEVSARTGEGIGRLREAVCGRAMEGWVGGREGRSVIMEARHKEKLEEAAGAVARARKGIQGGVFPEVVAVEIRSALERLGEIVGEGVSEEVLDEIFGRFCIGK